MALCALLACLAGPTPRARADGDPASDVLLGESVFYPYTPPVPAAVSNALNREMTAVAKAHFPLKVALIASPIDLGVIPNLFGQPQKYADFLDQEISFQGKQPLLVVMAAGYGVQGLPPAATAAAATLPKPTSGTSEGLARAAMAAVSRLARAAGHPISAAPAPGASSTGGGSGATLFIAVAAVALLGAGTLVGLRLRRPRPSRSDP
ncbi:MAG TPA: hypothetical protein VKT31_09330 [Solirubrobacteraceae bacterium]|nr:hypothetical protein [Solirubrobacteraceae bacterium]